MIGAPVPSVDLLQVLYLLGALLGGIVAGAEVKPTPVQPPPACCIKGGPICPAYVSTSGLLERSMPYLVLSSNWDLTGMEEGH